MARRSTAAAPETDYGTTINATVKGGGLETVQAGGSASGTIVSSGGKQVVFGTASGTTINSGGTETTYGTASGTTVNSGGNESTYGTTVSTTVGSGGLETVQAGGSASGTTLGNGGSQAGVRDGAAGRLSTAASTETTYGSGERNDGQRRR